MVIFQAGAYAVLYTGACANQVGWTLVGQSLRKTSFERSPRHPFCACATARSEFETRQEVCDGCQLDGDVLGAGPLCKEQQQGVGASWGEVQYRLWTGRGPGTFTTS